MSLNKLSLLFLSSIFVLLSCSKDDNPPGGDLGPSIKETIDIDGGIIEFNGIIVDIAPGAFDQAQNIEIIQLEQRTAAFDNVVTSEFRIDGLPATTYGPINIAVEFADIDGEEKLVLGSESWVKSYNDFSMSHHFLSTRDSLGYLVATIPAFDGKAQFKDDQNSPRDLRHWFDVLGVGKYTQAASKAGHFLIHTPTVQVDDALNLAEDLEAAYDKFKAMGFDYGKRTSWPVEVTVKKLDDHVFGAFVASILGKNSAILEINQSILGTREDRQVTAGHEFFHLVQDWYDTRSIWQKVAKDREGDDAVAPQLWLDEAMSVWSEQFFTNRSSFAPLLFEEYHYLMLNGAQQAYGGRTERQDYGYAMAGLIEYLYQYYGGDATMVDVYEKVEQGRDAMKAVNSLFISSLGARWPDILENIFEFEMFPAQTTQNSTFNASGLFVGLAQSRILNANQPVVSKTFTFDMPELSARAFNIKNNNFTDFDPDAVLTFDVLNDDNMVIQVYKTHPDRQTSEKIAEGTEVITISNFTELIKDGYKLAGMVINTEATHPFEDVEEVVMKISISQPIKFSKVEAGTLINGVFVFEEKDELWDLDTSYTRDSWSLRTLPLIWTNSLTYSTTVSGNTYTTVLQSNDLSGVDEVEYIFTSTFDDPSDPSQLDVLEFVGNWESSDTSGGYGQVNITTVRFKVRDLPFDKYDPLYHIHHFSGSISASQYEIAEYESETIYYSQGAIDPKRYKKEYLKSFVDGSAWATYHE